MSFMITDNGVMDADGRIYPVRRSQIIRSVGDIIRTVQPVLDSNKEIIAIQL